MASLTLVAFQTRKIIKYGALALLVFFIAKVILSNGISMWKKLRPPPPPPPTVSFNRIPLIKFPERDNIGGLEFTLETPTGTLPQLPDRAKVYFMPYQRPSLLALDKAKQEAALLGFTNEPEPISEKIFKWTRINYGTSSLEMDIFSGSFIYTYDWQNDQSILLEKNLLGQEQTKTEARSFLQKMQILEEDLLNGRTEISYLKVIGGKLVPAISPSEANFAKAELFRSNLDDYMVMTANPKRGIVSISFSGSSIYEKKIIRAEFNYFPIKYDSFGTYPIKTSLTAFNELKNGQGFIASWNGSGNKVIIRRVYLAYFDSETPQQFLQPIIVFEGDEDFFGYVAAVTKNWNL